MEGVATELEKSGVAFVWALAEPIGIASAAHSRVVRLTNDRQRFEIISTSQKIELPLWGDQTVLVST
jgi:hypothetical protein